MPRTYNGNGNLRVSPQSPIVNAEAINVLFAALRIFSAIKYSRRAYLLLTKCRYSGHECRPSPAYDDKLWLIMEALYLLIKVFKWEFTLFIRSNCRVRYWFSYLLVSRIPLVFFPSKALCSGQMIISAYTPTCTDIHLRRPSHSMAYRHQFPPKDVATENQTISRH